MKNRKINLLVLVALIASMSIVSSCGGDDDPALPGLTLTEVVSTGKAGDVVSISVAITTDVAFESLVITKLYDGVSQGTDTYDELPANEFTYEYTILEADAEQILSFNFLLKDAAGQEVSRDWVITVQLNAEQLLLKYDWRLSDEIRGKTSESDINEAYTDDVYRFNEDGTYQKSNGGTEDDFNDSWFNYCFYDINNTTLRLLMSRTGAFEEDEVDTVNITLIDDSEIVADVTYYGLDEFNEGGEEVPYEAVEEYVKKFVSVAKTSSFDPYGSGSEDDDGPGAACIEQDFDN